VFRVECRGGGLWLHSDLAYPSRKWDAGLELMFAVRKLET